MTLASVASRRRRCTAQRVAVQVGVMLSTEEKEKKILKKSREKLRLLHMKHKDVTFTVHYMASREMYHTLAPF